MKNFSILLSVTLLIPIIYFANALLKLYAYFGNPAVPRTFIYDLARPAMIFGSLYLVVAILSIYLNIRKKYALNILITGIAMILYIIGSDHHWFTWSK